MQQLKMPTIRASSATAPAVQSAPRTLADLSEGRRTMLSLPAWAASRVKWSGAKVDVPGKGSVPVLNRGFGPMTALERDWVTARLADVERALSPTDGGVWMRHDEDLIAMTQEEVKLIFVTKLLLSKPSAAMTEDGAAARGEAYMFALAAVTAWSVDLAIRGWHAGTTAGVDNRADFKWAPDTAVLRRAALDEMRALQALRDGLVAMRDAKPLDEVAG